ncbi:TIGR01212 family radical SAM protein [Acerihabitans arboris]|uniref:TIGR01212 family radical SAM protein n=1 Tax=Acerihabitans arboris TaxID=2691583 RepID=A0A845SI20_9GAMM|nr:TIGR01212 family radical SAM protein [Acerihabitans arboris]NDL63559.1 TIGR01212 family radical SAM protein [Acerihabitans arboris]
MQLLQVVNMFGGDLLRRYGQKVYKLSLHGGFSCPNRDGTLGRGGCTFCNVASFADEQSRFHSVGEQIAGQAASVDRAKRYLAYFQAYTSTYAEVRVLDRLYREALAQADIVGICVGTRPDCAPPEVLDLLAGYQSLGYEVWLELGLQSAQDKTLRRINRGHDFACYRRTLAEARRRGLRVCTHLIVGLPGEGAAECMSTLEQVLAAGVDGLKLHPLLVVEGSVMAKAWRAGRLAEISLEDYTAVAGDMIRHTPPAVVFHRICASARPPTLLAPLWCANHWNGMNSLYNNLRNHGVQGCALGTPFRPAS